MEEEEGGEGGRRSRVREGWESMDLLAQVVTETDRVAA